MSDTVLQKQHYHQHDYNGGFEEGYQQFVDAGGYKVGGVEHYAVIHTGREVLFQLFKLGLAAFGHIKGVGSGQLADAYHGRLLSVDACYLGIAYRVQVDTGNVFEVQQASVRVGAQYYVAEFSRVAKLSAGCKSIGESLVGW